MPRRARPTERRTIPDRKYQNVVLQQFINKVMRDGKRSTAEGIVYDAIARAEAATRKPGIEVFETGLRNATPLIEVKPRRVGGATYQVPVEIKADRRGSLAMRWIIQAARKRPGKSMAEKLSSELMDATNNAGAAVRRKDETHKMAEANKAFSHYKW
ncbi:MAG: 30S ribosomal protein S7 [Candidatus Limnocylindrales bacterium]|nr:30S ribosomal protein S7 [Candidatus Saccharimonadales bacterium]